jgi:hypothetical protein
MGTFVRSSHPFFIIIPLQRSCVYIYHLSALILLYSSACCNNCCCPTFFVSCAGPNQFTDLICLCFCFQTFITAPQTPILFPIHPFNVVSPSSAEIIRVSCSGLHGLTHYSFFQKALQGSLQLLAQHHLCSSENCKVTFSIYLTSVATQKRMIETWKC